MVAEIYRKTDEIYRKTDFESAVFEFRLLGEEIQSRCDNLPNSEADVMDELHQVQKYNEVVTCLYYARRGLETLKKYSTKRKGPHLFKEGFSIYLEPINQIILDGELSLDGMRRVAEKWGPVYAEYEKVLKGRRRFYQGQAFFEQIDYSLKHL